MGDIPLQQSSELLRLRCFGWFAIATQLTEHSQHLQVRVDMLNSDLAITRTDKLEVGPLSHTVLIHTGEPCSLCCIVTTSWQLRFCLQHP